MRAFLAGCLLTLHSLQALDSYFVSGVERMKAERGLKDLVETTGLIIGKRSNGETIGGNGTLVSPRHVVTAAHVIEGMICDGNKDSAQFVLGVPGDSSELADKEYRCLRVLFVDQESDTALFEILGASRNYLEIAEGSVIVDGAHIEGFGYLWTDDTHRVVLMHLRHCEIVHAKGPENGTSTLSGRFDVKSKYFFETACISDPGFSGGPLVFRKNIDEKPKMMGVHSARSHDLTMSYHARLPDVVAKFPEEFNLVVKAREGGRL